VEDTGSGMSDETRQRMFDPFFTTKGAEGTGLGLSVSYQVIQRHGGEFSVFSEEGKGSRIRVALPALGQARPVAAPPNPVKGPSPLLQRTRTCGSILLIDDDAAVRETLAEILVSKGHEVVGASGGAEGLKALEAGTFDLVLTDLGMPDMNGWEVAERIRTLSPGTPIGVITGWGASLDEARLEEYGVDLILAKPFRFDQVLEVVGNVLSARRS
jgi:CheY-like chemotaxis protein